MFSSWRVFHLTIRALVLVNLVVLVLTSMFPVKLRPLLTGRVGDNILDWYMISFVALPFSVGAAWLISENNAFERRSLQFDLLAALIWSVTWIVTMIYGFLNLHP